MRLELTDVGYSVEGDKLLEQITCSLTKGITYVVGKNGAGKSTLLSNIATRGPGLTISPKVRIGYFWQMSYRFTSDETVLELLKNHSEYEDEGFLRSILHSM